jgi:hypothetical protein
VHFPQGCSSAVSLRVPLQTCITRSLRTRIGIAMYETGGSKHDTFHKKRSGIGWHDVGLILEVVCFLCRSRRGVSRVLGSRHAPEQKPLEITGCLIDARTGSRDPLKVGTLARRAPSYNS